LPHVPGAAAALRAFFTWIVSPAQGNDAALPATVHFAPLPDRVRAIARAKSRRSADPDGLK
jgi:hypothetical protein